MKGLPKELVVYDGHFWININNTLSQERKKELKEDLENTDNLLLVKDELWARVENPHPTRRQKTLCKADWRPEDIESPSLLKKVPKIKE